MKIGITNLELHEYFQNGCIRVKDTMMDFSHNGTYVYYGHEAGYKQYRRINFEEEFDMYRYRGNGKSECYVDLFAYKYVHPEYGMLLIENHHENYLVELREKEHIDKLLRLSKRRGYRTEIVGERQFVCIWKQLKE